MLQLGHLTCADAQGLHSAVLMVPVSLDAVYTVRLRPDSQFEGGRSLTRNLGSLLVVFCPRQGPGFILVRAIVV